MSTSVMKGFKLMFLSGLACAVIFALLGSITNFGEWDIVLIIFFFGFFTGVVAVPAFEPKLFKHAWAIQITAGAIAGALAGNYFTLSLQYIIITSIVGAILGLTAKFWVDHVHVP